MSNLIKTTLQKKLLFAFIVVGFFPFLIFYLYVIYWGEEKVVNRIIDEQYIQVQKIIDRVDNHINSLNKEIKFISKLDLMDDIIAEDIDKRISRLLIQKKEDIALDVELFVVDTDAKIIASSNIQDKRVLFKNFKKLHKSHFFIGSELYLRSKIYASFDKTKLLGYLVLKYNTQNLNKFLVHQKGVHNSICDIQKNICIGDKTDFLINTSKNVSSYISKEHLVTYKKLSGSMNNYYIIYGVDKELALSFLYDLLYFMLYMIPIVLVIILSIGIFSSKKIIKPLLYLTSSAEHITQTKDYSTEVILNSNDEIGSLAHAFNELLNTTNSALIALEEENKMRLKRFVELIEIFNTIIQTKNESECIDTSLEKMQKLTNNQALHFIKNETTNQNTMPIYVSDFDKDEKIYFGAIEIDLHERSDENEDKFYRSIVSMIALQLDRIRLIDKTMQASRAKSAFISNMSHELRTPLNAIIGFTQYMIAYEELNDEQNDMISNIESSAQYLLEMINGILDIAKIEAGKMEAVFDNINVASALHEISTMLSPLAEQKSLKFSMQVEGTLREYIRTDVKLFKQIIINVLSNAIKFTQEGSIEIVAKENQKELTISIKDSGLGIKPEDLKRLFNDFTQVENVMQKKHKGTGLGLSLSKKLAHLLGGDLILKSEGLGYGCEVIFTLRK